VLHLIAEFLTTCIVGYIGHAIIFLIITLGITVYRAAKPKNFIQTFGQFLGAWTLTFIAVPVSAFILSMVFMVMFGSDFSL